MDVVKKCRTHWMCWYLCWAEDWGMQFNIAKCKIMHMGSKNSQIRVQDGRSGTSNHWGRKGVRIQANLKPSAQCLAAARTTQGILRLITIGPSITANAMFLSNFTSSTVCKFWTQAWVPWSAEDTKALEKVQQGAVKMVAGLRATDYEDRLQELDLLTF